VEDSRATGVFNRDFFGGELEGVTQKLDYLKSLGVDAIWLTPIFKARSNHRYDTDDYMQVDPALGGDPAFALLVNAAHARGLRLILDGVFNHTSSDSVYFDRYSRYPEEVGACESPSSRYRDWYEITGNDIPCQSYSAFANLDSLPALNESSSAVREFIYRDRASSVVGLWTGRGADGWRLDAAQELSHAWWRDLRGAVKGYAPDAPLIGEDTAGPVDASPYLLGTELDGVMNYAFARVAPPQKPVVVVLNKADHDATAAIPIRGLYPNGVLQNVLTGEKFAVGGGQLRVTVTDRSGLVLVGTS